MIKVLVLYYSKHGSTLALAREIAKGIELENCEAVIKTVPEVSDNLEATQARVPDKHYSFVTKKDLLECAGIALGCPTHFGNMPAAMKYFWDSTTDFWMKGELVDKPACLFTSSSSMHGGQESTLLSMMLPLLHHGMCIIGLPYSLPQLHETQTGGSPYGVSHVARNQDSILSKDEKALSKALGQRLAQWSKRSVQ